MPAQVVTYLDTVPKSLSPAFQQETKSPFSSIFNTTSLRRDTKKRWSNNEIQHRSQSSLDETSRLILSETSDMAPLISKSSITQQKPVNRMGHTIGKVSKYKQENPYQNEF